MLNTQQQILEKYQQTITDLNIKLVQYKKEINRYSVIRLGVLLLEILMYVLFVSATENLMQLIWATGLMIPVAMFIIVIKWQGKAQKEESALKNLLWIYENELQNINHKANQYDNGKQFENESHPYLSDLDIFGKHSLFHLVNRCITRRGIDNLANSFSSPFDKRTILDRQDAIKELGGYINDTFTFRANLKDDETSTIEEIKAKLSGALSDQLKFVQNRILKIYVKILPFITIGLLFGCFIWGDRFWGGLTLLVLANMALSFFNLKKINLVYFGFSGNANQLNNYALAIKWIEMHHWKSAYINQIIEKDGKISQRITELGNVIKAFDARLNILVGSFLNATLLWDIKCSIKLDDWCKNNVINIQKGLDSIGDFEELISLATFAYNHPEVNYPIIKDDFFLSAKNIGHPLIVASKRVDNSFGLKDKPNVNIITGSNMAGKSTFLRTLGINMVMAYAGAAVCATQMELSIFNINTYMRIKDSINESTSTFKAELNRLKMILQNVEEQPNPLVLIDEMLRGTNSHDKYLGSKVFIEKMIAVNASTLFATHDLHLADMEQDQPEKVANYHFDIQIENGEMNFDYKLKHGPCKIFNAAILLKEIGLSLT